MFYTPPKCRSSPCSQDSFALDSVVFHAKLGRKPYIDLIIVAPEMFELIAVNLQNTSFFVFLGASHIASNQNLFWEQQRSPSDFNLGFLCARRIWWKWWGVARAVPSPWAQQFHLRGRVAMVGWFQLTNWRLLIEPLMVLCQVKCFILSWIYLHILPVQMYTLMLCLYVYTARIYSQYRKIPWTLPVTPPRSIILNTSALLSI